MKNAIFILLLSLAFGACKNNKPDPNPSNNPSAAAPAPVKFDSLSGKELSAKLGLDIEEKHFYKGFYTAAKDAQGKEVLHGDFKIESLGEIDYDDFEKMEMFSAHNYEGKYSQGNKEGVFKCEGSYYEAHEIIILVFKQNQCTEASYEGQAEGYCSAFKGKLDNCTFSQAAQKATDVECDFSN